MAIIKHACYTCICNRCEHEWMPHGKFKDKRHVAACVRICPRCKSVRWNN